MVKDTLPMFYHSLPRKHVARIRLTSFVTLVNAFVRALHIVKCCVSEHDMSCILEINGNDRIEKA